MNTTTGYESSLSNMTNNERGFRAVLGMVLVTKVIIGAIASPAAMFALAAMSVYLVMTAIMGIDPFYSLVQWFTQRQTRYQNQIGQVYA